MRQARVKASAVLWLSFVVMSAWKTNPTNCTANRTNSTSGLLNETSVVSDQQATLSQSSLPEHLPINPVSTDAGGQPCSQMFNDYATG